MLGVGGCNYDASTTTPFNLVKTKIGRARWKGKNWKGNLKGKKVRKTGKENWKVMETWKNKICGKRLKIDLLF